MQIRMHTISATMTEMEVSVDAIEEEEGAIYFFNNKPL